MAWTSQQEQAIYTRGCNIIVSAGAGSGKTAVLSERILDYCLKGNDIRRVLVLTFTNAAASEMKERIRQKLIDNNLVQQSEYIDAAYITTFDAYSLALVKKYYYKLNLAKDLTIMDQALIAIKRRQIIEALFSELYEANDESFFNILKKYSKQDDKEVINIIDKLCVKLDLIIDFEDFFQNYKYTYTTKEKILAIVDLYERYCQEAISDFINNVNSTINYLYQDLDAKDLIIKLEAFVNDLKSLKGYDDYYQYLSGYSLPRSSCKMLAETKKAKENLAKELKELKDKLFSKYIFKEDMIKELEYIQDDILYILNLCYQVEKRLLEYKESVMMFDYTDIAKFAIALVKNNVEIKNELKYYYKEILVDEYQDTSDIQETFLSLISNDNLYMVGDIKQSIYRFRNANPYIFKEKYDLYAQNKNGLKIDLSYNFRTRSESLSDINMLFNKLMTEKCGDCNYIKDHQMNYGLKLYDEFKDDINYNLEVLKYSKDSFENFTNEEIEAFITAKTIKSMIENGVHVYKNKEFQPASYSDFAILIDKAKSFLTFKMIFDYLNINLSIEADMDLKDSILPKLFSNILLVINKIQNDNFDIEYKHALSSIARSFIYQYNDEDIYKLIVLKVPYPILEDFKELASNINVSYQQLFYKIALKLDIYNKLSYIGDVDNSIGVLEYIYKIFDMLQNLAMPISEAVDYLVGVFNSDIKLSYKLQSSNKDSVKIMTIHKSKGLEFPICIFPMLLNTFNKEEIKQTVGFSKKYGIYIPFADEGRSNTIVKTLVNKETLDEDISEKVRLLYVALTRAREKMILILNDDEKEITSTNKFRSFQDMINYANVYSSYIKEISLNDYNITSNYKNQRITTERLSKGKKLNYDILSWPLKLSKEKISKKITKLPTKEIKNNIKLGLEMHNILQAIDFKNINLDNIEASSFIKGVLKRVLNLNIFKNISIAKTYHEHEFYFIKDSHEYHGIIDLFAVYEDHIDILDYKLANIESLEYINQLKIYKEYIKTKWDKRIDVYLLSLMNAEVKKLDI